MDRSSPSMGEQLLPDSSSTQQQMVPTYQALHTTFCPSGWSSRLTGPWDWAQTVGVGWPQLWCYDNCIFSAVWYLGLPGVGSGQGVLCMQPCVGAARSVIGLLPLLVSPRPLPPGT